VHLIWTDPPVPDKAPDRLQALRDAWRPLLAAGGAMIVLEPGNRSERSLEQITDDILRTTPPGALVVDPFCGTGTTGVAALAAGRNFYGCDTDPEMVRRASARLAGRPGAPDEARP
jgi:SAM-dependent methyltransferase